MARQIVFWAVLVLAAAGCGEKPDGGAFPTAVVERYSLEISAQAAGVIEPVSVVEVKSKAAGEIVDLPVESGDRVNAGHLLVQVEREEAENRLAQARADLQVAEAQLKVAETELARAREMFERGVISTRESEQAGLTHATAEAALVRAQADLQNAEEWLAETTVLAPTSGTILSCTVTRGQVIASATREVGGGTLLMRMADLREVQVRALVDETDIGKISLGMDVETQVDAYPGRVFKGRVLKIEPQAVYEQSVTQFPVIVRIANDDGLLLPGMSVETEFLVARHPDALVVPNQAVNTQRDAQTIAELIFDLNAGAFEAQLVKLPRDSTAERASDSTGRPAGEPSGGPAHPGRGGAPPGGGHPGGGPPSGGGGPRGGHPGGGPPGGVTRMASNRSAVVFRIHAGQMTPTEVMSGLTDYDRTEILEGLGEGDTVAVLPTASLLVDQKELRDRMRSWRQSSLGVRRDSGE